MKMSKNMVRGAAVFAVVLVVFNLIAFLIPFNHTGAFWVGYIFGLVAILAQIPILLIAFRDAESARSKFYGVPIARIGIIYLIAQMALSLIAMCLAWIAGVPAWPFVLVSLLLLAAAALGTIATDLTRDEIQRQDVQIKRDVSSMRELQSLGRSLTARCEDAEAASNLQKLSDALNYSDPVSSDATAESEAELKRLLDELQNALLEGDFAGVSGLSKQALNILDERNRICKLNK